MLWNKAGYQILYHNMSHEVEVVPRLKQMVL